MMPFDNDWPRHKPPWESLLDAPPDDPSPPVFIPRRPQLVAKDGRLVWPGHDVEVIPSQGDPNYTGYIINIVRAEPLPPLSQLLTDEVLEKYK